MAFFFIVRTTQRVNVLSSMKFMILRMHMNSLKQIWNEHWKINARWSPLSQRQSEKRQLGGSKLEIVYTRLLLLLDLVVLLAHGFCPKLLKNLLAWSVVELASSVLLCMESHGSLIHAANIKLNMTLRSWQNCHLEASHPHRQLFLSEKMINIAKDFRTW